MSTELLLTVTEAAARLRVHPETVRRLLRGGRITGSQPIGMRGGWKVPESEVGRLLAEGVPDLGMVKRRRRADSIGRSLARAGAEIDKARARGDRADAERWLATAAGIVAAARREA